MTKDGIELPEYLRNHLGKDRTTVVAHSFGTILGLGMPLGTSKRLSYSVTTPKIPR
jgi:hypothetical protein